MSASRAPRPQQGNSADRKRTLELVALSSLAIAQPTFDVLSRGTTFFVAHDSRAADLTIFAALLYLTPPLLLAAIVALTLKLRTGLGRAVHGGAVSLLVTMILLPPVTRLGAPTAVSLPLALAVGAAFALALERFDTLRSFLALLSPLTLAAPLVFLFASPAAELLRPERVEALGVEIQSPTPIVFLLLDELPLVSLLNADREIDAAAFPNFARLARSSHWFRNATAVSASTDYAVPAILTGRYPDGRRPPIASEYPRSLFTLVGGSYDLRVIETQTRVCPSSICGGDDERAPRAARLRRLLIDTQLVYLHILLPAELTARLPSVTATWTDFATAGGAAVEPSKGADPAEYLSHLYTTDRVQVFRRFVDGLGEPNGAPTLHFAHLMLPHVPWAYLPSGNEYWASLTSSAFAEGVADDTTWSEEPWLVAQGYQRHLLQVAFVDRLVGQLLDRLDETGLADRALLIVTADHGLSFQPGQPGRRATEQNYADVMSVPLFVRPPGGAEGVVDDRNVEVIDIFPTIADLLGVELPFEVDGGSVYGGGVERSLKTLRTTPDESFTVEPATLERKYDSLARKLELFPDGGFASGISASPSHRELLDRPVAALPVGPAAAVQVRLDQPEQYGDVDPSSRYTPAHVFGRARWDESPEHLDLAIAVNGVVRATTRTFVDQGSDRFAVLVPEESFVAGENSIQVFTVETAATGPVLHPTNRNERPYYRLERGGDGRVTALLGSDGNRCRLDPEAVDGGFVAEGSGRLGWALDPSGERPFVVIMAFADDRLVHTTTTGSEPAGTTPVSDHDGFESAGFRFNLPVAVLERGAQLRIFAVLGDRGSELRELGDEAR